MTVPAGWYSCLQGPRLLWCLGCLLGLLGTAVCGATDATPFDRLIVSTAARHGVEAALVKAVIKCESNFDATAVSPRGAQGLMQLMPTTQRLLGLENAFDPAANIEAGVQYLAMLQRLFGQALPLVLAAYNAGPQAVIAAGYTLPALEETRQYVQCVLAARRRYHRHLRAPLSPMSSARAEPTSLLRVPPLRFSPQYPVRVGQRVTIRLEAVYTGTQPARGVVMLTYPATLVSLAALHTTATETTVQLAPIADKLTALGTGGTAVYRLLQGSWPAWRPGQHQTALLMLVPQVEQDLALHVSIVVYTGGHTTARARWSTVVRLPVQAKTW